MANKEKARKKGIKIYRAEAGRAHTDTDRPDLVTRSKSSQAPYEYFEGIDEAEMTGDPSLKGVYSEGLEPGIYGMGGLKTDKDLRTPKENVVVKEGKGYKSVNKAELDAAPLKQKTRAKKSAQSRDYFNNNYLEGE